MVTATIKVITIIIAQIVIDTTPDGIIGSKTLEQLNRTDLDPEYFIIAYSLAKVARYAEICNNDKSQTKFLLGWINRTLGGLDD